MIIDAKVELFHLTSHEILMKVNGVFIHFEDATYAKGEELWNLVKYKEAWKNESNEVNKIIGAVNICCSNDVCSDGM
jgi:hypothetical protein